MAGTSPLLLGTVGPVSQSRDSIIAFLSSCLHQIFLLSLLLDLQDAIALAQERVVQGDAS